MLKPYFETDLGKLYHGDCLEILPHLEPVDLVITSPPYGDLREYNGYTFDYKATAKKLKSFLSPGGVCVWVTSDQTRNGSESGTSFRQALYFKDECGFNIHDTMIYQKTPMPLSHRRYEQAFEYMFIFSKGEPKYFNPILFNCSNAGRPLRGSTRRHDLKTLEKLHGENNKTKNTKIAWNVWFYDVGFNKSTKDRDAYEHPAIFPEFLVMDHIMSWSDTCSIVSDIMCGSGTTLKIAERLGRKWIGIEISEKYCEIAAKRITKERSQLRMF